MSRDIMVSLNEEEFTFLRNLISKEPCRDFPKTYCLPCLDFYVDENHFNKAMNKFITEILDDSKKEIIIESLREVFNVPMVNLRLSDAEAEILDYAVFKSPFNSRKTFLVDNVRDMVKHLVGLPQDINVTDEELLVFIEAHKIDEYEKMRHFAGEDQFKLVIEKSALFKDMEEYEKTKAEIYGQVGRRVKDHE